MSVIKGIKAIRICITKCILMDRWGLFITQVYAYINVQNICTLIRRAGRAGGRAGFACKSLHKISVLHLFLQNALQNLVRSTSKRVTLRCFCYF